MKQEDSTERKNSILQKRQCYTLLQLLVLSLGLATLVLVKHNTMCH